MSATIEEDVQAVLVGDAGVTAIVPAERIKPPGSWQELRRPYIIHMPISSRNMAEGHDNLGTLVEYDYYQVSCFANDYPTAYALAKAVTNALRFHNGSFTSRWTGDGPVIEEREVQPPIFHIPVNFRMFKNIS